LLQYSFIPGAMTPKDGSMMEVWQMIWKLEK